MFGIANEIAWDITGAVNRSRFLNHVQLPTLKELGVDRNDFLPTIYSDTAVATGDTPTALASIPRGSLAIQAPFIFKPTYLLSQQNKGGSD